MKAASAPLNIITLNAWPIFDQLRLEEALLRADQRNWCILNTGAPPAIVMGISGKPSQLINDDFLKRHPIPVIRRFSGGGTVYIDQNTFFVTLIFNSQEIDVPYCPKNIFAWSERLYSASFDHFDFKLRENDYTAGGKKFGGNAQYLSKNRWLHHTSFLWDFDPHSMQYLQMPAKTPGYREGRSHKDFLCPLKHWIPSKEILLEKIKCAFLPFNSHNISVEEVESILELPHRKSTEKLIL